MKRITLITITLSIALAFSFSVVAQDKTKKPTTAQLVESINVLVRKTEAAGLKNEASILNEAAVRIVLKEWEQPTITVKSSQQLGWSESTAPPATTGTGVFIIPTKPAKKPYTARQAAMEMLRLANRISDSNLKGKDEIAEMAELLSTKLLEKNNTWLCGTDTECAKLEKQLK